MMIATKNTESHAQALLDMAKDEAKIALSQEAAGLRTLETPPPTTSSAPLPPKSLYGDDKERSGGNSLDGDLLSYLSGDIPPQVPPSPEAQPYLEVVAPATLPEVSISYYIS